MDENFSINILYDDEYIPDELYNLVQNGLCSQLATRLDELPNSNQYLTSLSWYGQQQLSLLMVAVLKGYDDIVRLLLTHCDSKYQIELKGKIILFNEERVDDITALYCACYWKHFTIAKTLIELGHADLNQDTAEYPYYPLLIHATIMNRFDIVQFLVENKYADVNETKSTDLDQCTALIWAAFRDYTSLIEYFIKNGADINYSCQNKGLTASTPVTCAALRGHTESIRLLYNAGANMHVTTTGGETLLMIAVDKRHYSLIDFLLEESINTIEDLELIICSLVPNDWFTREMHDVFHLLRFILQKRETMGIEKRCIEPIVAYNYAQECQTVNELDFIKNKNERIFLETLLIRERIFSVRKDISLMKPLHYYGDMLVDRNKFHQCYDLWIHMFYLYQQLEMDTILHRFVWLFCRMFTAKQKIPIQHFLQVCRLIFEPSQMKEKTLTTVNAIFLVVIANKILEQEEINKEERTLIYCWVRDLCRQQLTTEHGETLLHLCVDDKTNNTLCYRSDDTTRYLKFPNYAALRLLLTCGSRWLDINAKESFRRNTPLHIICQNTQDQQIIQLLLDFGAHIDCVNKYGRTPIDYIDADDENIRTLFMPKPTPLNLKCLCAHLIVDKNLKTNSICGSTLHKFISLHSRDSYSQAA